jgi:hypothetical protein
VPQARAPREHRDRCILTRTPQRRDQNIHSKSSCPGHALSRLTRAADGSEHAALIADAIPKSVIRKWVLQGTSDRTTDRLPCCRRRARLAVFELYIDLAQHATTCNRPDLDRAPRTARSPRTCAFEPPRRIFCSTRRCWTSTHRSRRGATNRQPAGQFETSWPPSGSCTTANCVVNFPDRLWKI